LVRGIGELNRLREGFGGERESKKLEIDRLRDDIEALEAPRGKRARAPRSKKGRPRRGRRPLRPS
jgi:hypothetical protein